MKRVIPIVIVLAVLVGGYFAWSRIKPEDENILRLSGNIEFRKIDMSFKTAGKLIELTVDEGDNVKQGMLIARLDREQMTRMRTRDHAGIGVAESNLKQLHTGIEYQRASMESELGLRRAELRQAQAKLQELLDGSRPQDIASARAVLNDAKVARDQAQRDYERAQKLIEKEDISQSQFDQFRSRFESTVAQVQNAEQRLGLILEGPRKTDIESARAAVARADAAIRMTEAQKLEILRQEEDLGARRADLVRARASVSVIDSQLDDTTIFSPADGVVLVKSADPGEVLAAGTPVVTIGEIDKPWLRGYIPQAKLGRIQLGMPVRVRSDSYPNKIYNGKISFIASEAEFTPKQIQTNEERVKLVYRIKVDIENSQRELKLNMPVDAEIQLK
ncbi:HlyD family efflux transporter periplasmic adaptor subunit [Bryobacter aggregatus]|uniref:HlyD family efflux transporter periplasmic adaptor subunit n=1 Tax=Bryobacter aggregatus TaxID=360054 RepID=UPI0004E1700E|nr:HlyD family efflux transporter periplasmic adaptor subunit [Bryobacter aggregatus]